MKKKQRAISKEERQKILQECPQYIEACGVKNYQRAKFISLVSKEIMNSENEKLLFIKPRIYDHSNKDCWNMAYSIVKSFLNENNCSETLKTLTYEINEKFPIENPELNFEGNSDDFDDLLNYIPTEDETSMQWKVQRFLKPLKHENQGSNTQDSENNENNNQDTTQTISKLNESVDEKDNDDGLIDINDFSSDEFAIKSDN